MVNSSIIPMIEKLHGLDLLTTVLNFPMISIEGEDGFTLSFGDLQTAEVTLKKVKMK